jgi:hypothetical protein
MIWLLHNDQKNAKSFGWDCCHYIQERGCFPSTFDCWRFDCQYSPHQISSLYLWRKLRFQVSMSHGLLLSRHFVETLFHISSTSRGLMSSHHFVETLFQVITSHGSFCLQTIICLSSVLLHFQAGFLLNSYLDSWDSIIAKLCHRPGFFEAESLLLTLWSFNSFLCCHRILHKTIVRRQSTKTPP